MRISWEEASSMLEKYTSSAAPVVGLLESPTGEASANLMGKLQLVDDGGHLWLLVIGGAPDMLKFAVSGDCLWEYSDSREAPPAFRSVAKRLESVLSVINPLTKMRFHVFEQKDVPPSPR
jgi:hypothetical protein